MADKAAQVLKQTNTCIIIYNTLMFTVCCCFAMLSHLHWHLSVVCQSLSQRVCGKSTTYTAMGLTIP